eukprot:7377284-Prymnesium_polylepis.1
MSNMRRGPQSTEAMPLVKSAREALRAVRREKRMEMSHLHALIESALIQAARPVRDSSVALQKPVASGQPTNIVKNFSWPRRWRSGAAPSRR